MACPCSVPVVSQEVHLGTAKQTEKVQGEKKPRKSTQHAVGARVGACKNLGKHVSGQRWRLKWAKKDGLVPVEGGHFRVIQTGKEMTVVSRLKWSPGRLDAKAFLRVGKFNGCITSLNKRVISFYLGMQGSNAPSLFIFGSMVISYSVIKLQWLRFVWSSHFIVKGHKSIE